MHKYSINMFLYCGLTAKNLVQKRFISAKSFAHKHSLIKNLHILSLLCTFLTQVKHQFLHTFFIQFTSVGGVLFTKSTGPTITTTIN